MKRTIYLTDRGLMLRRAKGALVLHRDGTRIKTLPPHLVGRVLLWSGAGITTPALRLLLEHQVDVVFLARGRYLGSVSPPLSAGVVARIAQTTRYLDPTFALETAQSLIVDKCHGQAALLRNARARGGPTALSGPITALDAAAKKASTAPSHEHLRGVEGAAARSWFEGFALLLPEAFPFNGRNRRPPRDPVNAMLSFGYMLLTHEVNAELQARGFDPRLGFFHSLRAGRPALALDLIEPWRAPAIDRLVLTVTRRRQFKADDFRSEVRPGDDAPAVLFKPEALKRFIGAYEQHMGSREPEDKRPSVRRAIAAWLDRFEARLLGGAEHSGSDATEPEADDGTEPQAHG